jgi:hypothetical protein
LPYDDLVAFSFLPQPDDLSLK